jgi:hypothetical protein
MKKTIFIDLDGTLFNDSKEVAQRNLQAIERAKSLDYEVVISTGRSLKHAGKVSDMIGSNYAIYSNGNVYDWKNKRPIHETQMPTDELLHLMSIANNKKVNAFFANEHNRYLLSGSTFGGLLQRKGDIYINGFENLEQFLEQHKFPQVNVISTDFDIVQDIRNAVQSAIGESSKLVIADQSKCLTDPRYPVEKLTYFKLATRDSAKGNAIKIYGDTFGVEKLKRIGIGDDINDLSMFVECGFNVAMGNAIDEVKRQADYVTDTNNNDGVAKYLERL